MWLAEAFKNLGGDDKAAKGSALTVLLKNKVIEKYGKEKNI
jgi:hypothetical protein